MCLQAGATPLVAGVRSLRRREVETRRSSPYMAFRGSIQLGFGSRVVYATRVIHLGTIWGREGLWSWNRWPGRKLHGGHRRRARSCAVLGTRRSVRGVVRVLGARASPKGGRAWLWHAAGSLPWRSSGGGTLEMVFPLLQWTTGPRI